MDLNFFKGRGIFLRDGFIIFSSERAFVAATSSSPDVPEASPPRGS
jgi:hypothetical protein